MHFFSWQNGGCTHSLTHPLSPHTPHPTHSYHTPLLTLTRHSLPTHSQVIISNFTFSYPALAPGAPSSSRRALQQEADVEGTPATTYINNEWAAAVTEDPTLGFVVEVTQPTPIRRALQQQVCVCVCFRVCVCV